MTFKHQPAQMVCGMNVAGTNLVDNRGRWHLSYDSRISWYGCATTALVLDNRVFFILRGDHREAWGKAADAGDLDGALGYFMVHEAQVHAKSEHRMALGLEKDEFALMPTLAELVTPEHFASLHEFFKRTDHESH